MLKEEANMVMDYLKEGGFLTEELEELITQSIKEEEPHIVLHPVSGAEELKELNGCKVYLIQDVENKEENFSGTEITFHNEKTGMYINILYDNDGELSLSQWY